MKVIDESFNFILYFCKYSCFGDACKQMMIIIVQPPTEWATEDVLGFNWVLKLFHYKGKCPYQH